MITNKYTCRLNIEVEVSQENMSAKVLTERCLTDLNLVLG